MLLGTVMYKTHDHYMCTIEINNDEMLMSNDMIYND